MAEATEKPADMAVAASHSDSQDSKAEVKGHAFNEQTNYVPRRTIITVGEWDDVLHASRAIADGKRG